MAPTLRLYNTLTRTKEHFVPIDPLNVRLYACGPTVYDDAHIGNARPIIVFDLLFRLLRHLYGPDHVTYVRNVTDVDDRINARAAERGISIRELTEGTLARFHEDIRALGVLMPEDVNEGGKPPRMVEPRATDHVEEMKALIERLVASGHAYVAEDHVLFDVPSMPDYGRLSRRPLDEMEAGARVDVAPYKRSPLDFVLWKPSGPSDPSWPSPAGIGAPGRPGWHIECSAMAWRHLGERFDIHAGGIDLVFPHHENEIAQTRCSFGTPAMANVWMHNGFLQVEGEKMAKSAGNFVTIRELLSDWPGEVIRLNMLKTHYRQPIDWRIGLLHESRLELSNWASLLTKTVPDCDQSPFQAAQLHPGVVKALKDDLNTPEAIKELRNLFSEAKRGNEDPISLWHSAVFLGVFHPRTFQVHLPIAQLSNVLLGKYRRVIAQLRAAHANGLREQENQSLKFLRDYGIQARFGAAGDVAFHIMAGPDQSIEAKIDARRAARAARNFTESDRIRDELAAMGIALKDNKDGTTTWEVAR